MRAYGAKLCIAILIVSLFAPSMTSESAHGATKIVSTKGILKIEISGLAEGALAHVEVIGPKFHRFINHPITLKGLKPGEYSLKPKKVVQSTGIEMPAPPTNVKVKIGVTSHASANYFFVPNTTLTISPQQTVSISGPLTGEQTVVISDSTVPIMPGEILASGPTASRPDGYLLSVTSVTTSGAETTVQAEPATLAQAVPDGSLNLEQALKEVNAAFSGATEAPNSISPRMKSSHSFPTYGLSCSGGGSIGVVPSVGFTFEGAGASLGWEYITTTLHVSMSFSVTASLAVSASAAANCSAEIPLIAGDGPPIVIDAGVPIVLTPTYSLKLEGNANVDGSLSQTLGESLGVDMSAQTFGDFSASVTPESNISPVDVGANASIDLKLIASVGIEVDGLAGVSVDAGPEVTLTDTGKDTIPWSLYGCVTGGFTANLLGDTVIDQSTALSWCRVLANAAPKATSEIEIVSNLSWLNLVVGTKFSTQIKAIGGKGPYVFYLDPARGYQVPPGLTISSTGLISGTPTKKGFYQMPVSVRGTEGSNPLHEFGFAFIVNVPGCLYLNGCTS